MPLHWDGQIGLYDEPELGRHADRFRYLLQRGLSRNLLPQDIDMRAMERMLDNLRRSIPLIENRLPPVCQAPILLIRAAAEPEDSTVVLDFDWRPFTQSGFTVIEIPSAHTRMLDPERAGRIADYLTQIGGFGLSRPASVPASTQAAPTAVFTNSPSS